MDSNTIKFGQLASLTAFTGQTQATEAFATAAIQNEVQVASLKNLSLGVEAAYQPHKLGQADPSNAGISGIREVYQRYRQAEYIENYLGVENIDKQYLLDYKRKVDTYVEMKYLPESAKAPKMKHKPIKNHRYTQEDKDRAKGFAGMD